MSRYPQARLDSCPWHQDRPPFPPVPSRRSGAKRSTRCRRSEPDDHKTRRLQAQGPRVGCQVRWCTSSRCNRRLWRCDCCFSGGEGKEAERGGRTAIDGTVSETPFILRGSKVPPANAHYRYHGYNKDLVNRFVEMGFDVPAVVSAFEYVGIDRNGGRDYELEEAYMGDITARLFNEE